MSEQKILDLQADLETIASQINAQINLTAAKTTAINQKMEAVENLKGGLLNTVLNERFEINNKLKYTNDTQRKIRFNELAAADVDFQTAQSALWLLEEQKKQAESEAEFQRKLFRAKELTMLFYANENA